VVVLTDWFIKALKNTFRAPLKNHLTEVGGLLFTGNIFASQKALRLFSFVLKN